jgi:hypothetical protein
MKLITLCPIVNALLCRGLAVLQSEQIDGRLDALGGMLADALGD